MPQKEIRQSIQWKEKWESPPTNLKKINVNAANNGRSNGGVGAVVRDELGYILAAATWPIWFSMKAHEAEALAAFLGLNFAKECCFTEVFLEDDNIEVVKALKHGTSNETCFAHELAQLALANPNCVWMEDAPWHVQNLALLDILSAIE
ncbi:hypothetical protein PIB30_040027 [Stylosanthes scabra]|uniref:RNase H type-1 domain-containing protein n=1 Tax=Stylosanthes scabra TaxID=79078 RepID=A0ABU6REI5_9FABA|nr:hypothetical protein [Stylosanthes scabra]